MFPLSEAWSLGQSSSLQVPQRQTPFHRLPRFPRHSMPLRCWDLRHSHLQDPEEPRQEVLCLPRQNDGKPKFSWVGFCFFFVVILILSNVFRVEIAISLSGVTRSRTMKSASLLSPLRLRHLYPCVLAVLAFAEFLWKNLGQTRVEDLSFAL